MERALFRVPMAVYNSATATADTAKALGATMQRYGFLVAGGLLSAICLGLIIRWSHLAFAMIVGCALGVLMMEVALREMHSNTGSRLSETMASFRERAPNLFIVIVMLPIIAVVSTMAYFYLRAPRGETIRTADFNRTGPFIEVAESTYGQSCGSETGNATSHLRQSCDGLPFCRYRIYVLSFGPDPKPGCLKDFSVKYSCAGIERQRSAMVDAPTGDGESVTLQCQ